MILCDCGCGNVDTAKFCAACGKRLTVSNAVLFCVKCNAIVERGMRFCPSCGNLLGDDSDEEKEDFENVLTALAERGDSIAQYTLAMHYYDRSASYTLYDKPSLRWGQYDSQTVVNWLTLAARQGNAAAMFELGLMYDLDDNARVKNDVISEDKEKALDYFIKAADQGHAAAAFYAAMKSEWLDKCSDEEAFALYKKAAELGDAYAQYEVGQRYETGDGVEQDESAAVKWFMAAAAQGNEDAIQIMKYRLPDLS